MVTPAALRPTRWMLDTNMVSYAIKGTYPQLREQMARRPPAVLCISAVTQSELLYGLAKKPGATRLEALITEFSQWIDVLDWTTHVASVHGRLRADLERQGVVLGAFDLMIAAHALATEVVLVSNDRAFLKVPNLEVENWSE